MPGKSVSITPTFAPETQFEVKTQSGGCRFDLAEVQEAPVAEQVRPPGRQLFEKRGVPFSALND